MKPFLPLLFLGCLICICSCVSGAKIKDDQLYAYITDSSKFILMPPLNIEKSMDAAQHISASYQGRDYRFVAWVKADETGIDMSLFNELGSTVGDLSYRNGAISFSSQIFPQSLKPEYIVADFQLCFYDPLLLRQTLENCGLVLETGETTRRILKDKDMIIEIEKNKNSVKLVNRLRGYAYTLEGDFF